MDKYIEMHLSNVERNRKENVCLDQEFEPTTTTSLVTTTELSRPINIHGSFLAKIFLIRRKTLYNQSINGPSISNYHFPPLTKFLLFKKHTTNKFSPCHDLLFQQSMPDEDRHSTKCNKKERKYRSKYRSKQLFTQKKENL